MDKIVYKPNQVRLFLVLLLAFAGAWTWKLKGTVGPWPARWAAMLGEALFVGAFLAAPKAFFPVFKVILRLSGRLGSLIFGVIAAAVFTLVLTPVALLMRLGGKRFMPTRPDPEVPSYYEPGEGEHDFGKQF